LWLSAGGAVTHGFPEGWSGAAFADAVGQWKAIDLSLGGVIAPKRSHALSAGREVDIRLTGGRARGCYAFWQTARGLRASGCATVVVARLGGEGRSSANDVTSQSAARAWWLFGAGPDVFVPLSLGMGIGISGTVLVPDGREVFLIPGVEGAYQTDSIVGWVGLDLRLRIW
jgi:hypothetical protein